MEIKLLNKIRSAEPDGLARRLFWVVCVCLIPLQLQAVAHECEYAVGIIAHEFHPRHNFISVRRTRSPSKT